MGAPGTRNLLVPRRRAARPNRRGGPIRRLPAGGGAMDKSHALFVPEEPWPALPLAAWQDTYATLHLWSQIVGKISLALAPRLNHWWNTAFQLTARGLKTQALRCGAHCFDIEFDFVA